jgi:hypothetical protein
MKDWLGSLPTAESNSKCVFGWDEAYSPMELLEAIENQTEFGEDFLSELYAIHRRMRKRNPRASVTDLIRMSIIPAHDVQKGMNAT